jgi:hypothetical protein
MLFHPWSLGVAGIAVLLGLWTLVAGLGVVDRLFLPTPAAVVAAGQEEAASGDLWRDISASVLRVLGGFGLSALVALPLGIAMGANTTFCRLLEPLLDRSVDVAEQVHVGARATAPVRRAVLREKVQDLRSARRICRHNDRERKVRRASRTQRCDDRPEARRVLSRQERQREPRRERRCCGGAAGA